LADGGIGRYWDVDLSTSLMMVRQRMINYAVRLLCLMACLSLLACASPRLAPMEQAHYRTPKQPTTSHTVQAGETLYAIAWLYDQDYRDLARYNGLQEPFAIQAGQPIYLTAPRRKPDQASAKPAKGAAVSSAKPATTARPVIASQAKRNSKSTTASRAKIKHKSASSSQTKTTAKPAATSQSATVARSRAAKGAISWRWPTKGNVIQQFAPTSGTKGIKISGKVGQAITAAADGTVAYSGSGLRGYGQLLIIKHNREYLSAYAHNRKLLVKEGDTVISGQTIAEMGDSEAAQVMLHFEIRKAGKPEDPLLHLRQVG
jgi:lipoprotein NlpD